MSQWHGGKGSKPRPIKNRDEFNNNWDQIFKKKESLTFWSHYCIVDDQPIDVESGSPCNWCGLTEDQAND